VSERKGLARSFYSDYIENVFLIYDLEEEESGLVDAYVSDSGGTMVVWKGLEVPTVLLRCAGEDRVHEFVSHLPRGSSYRFIVPMWMEQCVAETCEVTTRQTFQLFHVDKGRFAPVEMGGVERLEDDHAGKVSAEITQLWPASSDVEFVRRRLRDGIFYGIVENGELASVAGTLLGTDRAEALGFVYTRGECRGRGLGKKAVSAVTAEILESGRDAVLYVIKGNEPAERLYCSLGYRKHTEHSFMECTVP